MPCALLVEDEPDDLILIGRRLHDLGLKVFSAGTLDHARALMISRLTERSDLPFSIALVDLKLIGSTGNGMDVLRTFRELAPKMPTILVSGYDLSVVLKDAKEFKFITVASKDALDNGTLKMILDQHQIERRP